MAKDEDPVESIDQETKEKDTSAEDIPSEDEHKPAETPPESDATPHGGRLKHLARRYWRKKKLTIPLTILLLLAVILAVPFTRYKVLALFIQKQFSVTVLDSQTGNPVSGADVSLAGRTAQTDGEGKATLHEVPVGNGELAVAKSYYKDYAATVLVSLSDSQNIAEVRLEATGRQVPLSVTDRITGQALANVTVSVLDTTAKTDDKGRATIVLPPDQPTQKVTLKLDGYNHASGSIQVTTGKDDENKFALTPAGRIYFLSKQTGTIDVISTNLDGTDRKVVLKGTGREEDSGTIMLASRDWKYLALKSRREGEKAKVYLIETANGKQTVMDEGDADFQLIGWYNHDFVYSVTRNKEVWESKRLALKSYNAGAKALTVMQENTASGNEFDFAGQTLEGFYIVSDGLVYTTGWAGNSAMFAGKQTNIIHAKIGTTERTILKSFPANVIGNLSARLYAPDEVYFAGYDFRSNDYSFYEYEDGKIKGADVDPNTFFSKQYPTYLLSPSGKAMFWAEPRDGKNTLLIGDSHGKSGKITASASELTPYGWFTDDYLLASKDGSELYIMSKQKGAKPIKMSDYHKPTYDSSGYGYGYGGF